MHLGAGVTFRVVGSLPVPDTENYSENKSQLDSVLNPFEQVEDVNDPILA